MDSIRLQDHEITDHEPQMMQVAALEYDGVTVSDVDWETVLAQVPHAQDMVAERGLPDATLDRLRVVWDDWVVSSFLDGLLGVWAVSSFWNSW